jgi:hypothetical protein
MKMMGNFTPAAWMMLKRLIPAGVQIYTFFDDRQHSRASKEKTGLFYGYLCGSFLECGSKTIPRQRLSPMLFIRN